MTLLEALPFTKLFSLPHLIEYYYLKNHFNCRIYCNKQLFVVEFLEHVCGCTLLVMKEKLDPQEEFLVKAVDEALIDLPPTPPLPSSCCAPFIFYIYLPMVRTFRYWLMIAFLCLADLYEAAACYLISCLD